MARNAAVVREALGLDIVDGSLNIILKYPVMLADDTAIKMHFDDRPRLDWRGKLNEVDVWVHRWHGAPLHIVELLSAVHLRTELGLSDGDEAEIEVRKCDVRPLPRVSLMAWTLFWFGRRKWVYDSDYYNLVQERWSKRFGATQLGTEENSRGLAIALSKSLIRRVPGTRLVRDGLSRRRTL